jgi:hypothetical protein
MQRLAEQRAVQSGAVSLKPYQQGVAPGEAPVDFHGN